jgi:hypothetical protein
MNNNFKELLEQYSDEWETCVNSRTLEQLEENFSRCEDIRTNIFNWVFDNIEDGPEQGEYFATFGDLESNLITTTGDIPVFDTSFDIYESFDQYGAYYQRYGCMAPEYVISWDTESFLWADEDTVQIIKRPDVLMGE